jgi:nitrogen fixation NifU-like protein
VNNIFAHWQTPFNKGLQPGTHQGTTRSEICGDEITISLKVVDGLITHATWAGEGCTICLGMASLLTKWLIGKSLQAAGQLTKERFFKLADIPIERRREGCAVVALDALHQAIQ